MTEPWKKFTTLAELDALDDDLVVAGYRAGLRNEPDHSQTTQDYWHGFGNGQIDSGRAPVSSAGHTLSREDWEVFASRIFGGPAH